MGTFQISNPNFRVIEGSPAEMMKGIHEEPEVMPAGYRNWEPPRNYGLLGRYNCRQRGDVTDGDPSAVAVRFLLLQYLISNN